LSKEINMRAGWAKLRYLLPLAAVYIFLHALCIFIALPNSMKASYPFLIMAPWLAFVAFCWRAKVTSARTRLAWIMLSLGILLWAVGMSLSAWEDLSVHVPMSVTYFSDFSYFLYGVPILLVVSWPAENERIPLFLWLDGLQAVTTACLVYVTLFSVFPFMHQQAQPISVGLLSTTYTVENLVLAFAATVRLLTISGTLEERRFYQILTGFLWFYAVCTSWSNHMSIVLNEQTGFYDLLPTLPLLLLTVVVLALPAEDSSDVRVSKGSVLAQFIDTASPVFYTLSMLALGGVLVRQHFYVGITSIVIALIIYAVRTTALQGFYVRSQRALREARDELEEISLRDGLTGVANRRCFDQVLDREWDAAVRAKQVLSLLLIDLDYFKNLNDKYGHRVGDACLIQIAEALRVAVPRKGDLLARYGGEEFAAILVGTGREGAEVVAAMMLGSVRALEIENETAMGRVATISVGIATAVPSLDDSPERLVEAADRALYQAKEKGRNRVECFSGLPSFMTGRPVMKEVRGL
jgi:diguanylate cyclase (GGDEF)-like protein